jgi:hypothetical protein
MPAVSPFVAFESIFTEALGCARDDLRSGRTVVVPHGPALRCGNVVWAVRVAIACVVSVPPPMVRALSPLAQRHSPDEWFNRQFLLDVLRHPVRGVVGPVQLVCAGDDGSDWRTILPGQQAAPGVSECARYYAVLLKPTWP